MDKTQLLNIMRQQELEIERLNAEVEKLASGKDEQIDNLTYGSEKLLAEKDAQMKKLREEFERLTAETNENTKIMVSEFERLSAEKAEQLDRLSADVARLKTENEELAASVGGDSGQIEELLAEKDGQMEKQNARIIRLTVEKDEQRKEMEKLSAAMNKQAGQIEKLTAEKEELLSAASSAARHQPQFPLENPGSLAEASLSVAGVMQAAQEAADLYLQNIKMFEAEKAAAAEKIEQEAKERARAIITAAEQKCAELKESEKKEIGELQSVSFLYMDFIDKSHSALHEMIDRYKLTKLTPDA